MATQGPRGDAGSDGTPVGGTPPTRTVRTLTPPAAGMPYRAGGATEHDAAATAERADPRVAEAFARGADAIVVGRPISQAADPRAAAEAIQAEIASSFK